MKLNLKHLAMFTLAACTTTAASSAELRDLTSQSVLKASSAKVAKTNIEMNKMIRIDPRTGEVIKTTEGKTGGHSGSTRDSSSTPEQTPPQPYDYFDGYGANLTSYFLSELAMGVYSQATNEDLFLQDLTERFEPRGIEPQNIEVMMDDDLGTELAVFTIGNCTVISFRGTSGEGTKKPKIDQEIDLMDYPIGVNIGGKTCRIHEGFWISTDIVYDWVLEKAEEAHEAGRKVILTGHSLGGAKATVAALRLHYVDDIPVTMLQTFGSPKVGDVDFKNRFNDVGANDIKLAEVTERFVVIGDPATTFPHKELVSFYPFVIYYHHVGTTHSIFTENLDADQFDIQFSSGEIFFTPSPFQWNAFLSGGGEHMWYDDALFWEIVGDQTYWWIHGMLFDHESIEQ